MEINSQKENQIKVEENKNNINGNTDILINSGNELGILHFVTGVYGFENITEFKLVSENEQNSVLCLNPIKGDVPSFVLIDPYAIFPDYQPKLSETDLEQLSVESESELKFLVITVIKEDYTKSVVNLKSPIAINSTTCFAKQVIVENSDYEIRYQIFRDNVIEGE